MNLFEELDRLILARRENLDAIAEAGGMCGEQHDGFGCTLPQNHEGKHIAHGTTMEVIHTWET